MSTTNASLEPAPIAYGETLTKYPYYSSLDVISVDSYHTGPDLTTPNVLPYDVPRNTPAPLADNTHPVPTFEKLVFVTAALNYFDLALPLFNTDIYILEVLKEHPQNASFEYKAIMNAPRKLMLAAHATRIQDVHSTW